MNKKIYSLILSIAICNCSHAQSNTFSFELGQSTWHRKNGNTSRWGAAFQRHWKKNTHESNLNGYTDFNFSHWRVKPHVRRQHNITRHTNIIEAGMTPVLLYTFSSVPYQPFAEIGIGLHYLNHSRYGVKNLSTNFQFGDHFGIGCNLNRSGSIRISYRFQHYSNANIRKPNPGINFHLIRLSKTL